MTGDAFSMSLRSVANHVRDHKGEPELAGILESAADELDRRVPAQKAPEPVAWRWLMHKDDYIWRFDAYAPGDAEKAEPLYAAPAQGPLASPDELAMSLRAADGSGFMTYATMARTLLKTYDIRRKDTTSLPSTEQKP